MLNMDEIRKSKKAGTLPYTDIIVEKKHPIGYITINRAEKRNALTEFPGGTCDQLSQAFQEMADDPEIRVFQIKGAGDNFCAGFDMSQYDEGYWLDREKGLAKGLENEPWAALSALDAHARDNPESVFLPGGSNSLWWKELWDNPKPSVALVDSFCLGGGMWLCSVCDIVLATPNAVFTYPPIRYGASVTPEILPPWILGLRKAMKLVLTGQCIAAQEAYDCGYVTEIVAEEDLEEAGRKLCESIARVPPMTNYFSKQVMHQYFEGLGVRQTINFGSLACLIMEQSALPGHYWDFFNLIRDRGFTEAYKEQREKWGYSDPVMDREVARLKAKRGAGGGDKT